jgi:hypothetical protein
MDTEVEADERMRKNKLRDGLTISNGDRIWKYGRGECGEEETGLPEIGQCIVVGVAFPWWALSVGRLAGIRLISIWLRNDSLMPLVREYFPAVHVECGREPSEVLIGHMTSASVLLCDREVPRNTQAFNLNSYRNLHLVISMVGRKRTVSGWLVSRVTVNHAVVGGVTNGNHAAEVMGKDEWISAVAQEGVQRRTAQDLRSILKAGIPGVPCRRPEVDSLRMTNHSVVRLRPNVISAAGLFPANESYTRVETVFGGASWVCRRLTEFEHLLLHDVPEKLIRLAPESELALGLLLNDVVTPMKVHQALLTSINDRLSRALVSRENTRGMTRKRGRMTAVVVDRDTRVKRNRANDASGPPRRPDTTLAMSVAPAMFGNEALVSNPCGDESLKDGRTPAMNDAIIKPTEVCEMTTPRVKMTEKQGANDLKATKDDKAPVSTELWDSYMASGLLWGVMMDPRRSGSIQVLREFFNRAWRRSVMSSYYKWITAKKAEGFEISLSAKDAAREIIHRTSNSTMWEWNNGSRTMFWRWPPEFEIRIMEGSRLWMTESLKPWKRAQRLPRDSLNREKVMEKLDTIRFKGYVEAGYVESLIAFFDVPKGSSDIRMVYDGTASGLNAVLWAPWFPLPTVESLLRSLEPGTYMADNDVGEMFLNFMLHEDLRKLCGVDLTLYYPDEAKAKKGKQTLWERWCRCAMGLRTSPYQTVQAMLWAQEVIMGNKGDRGNVFRWDRMELNLPGAVSYNPSRPWVAKLREDGVLAADLHLYVDDLRPTAPTDAECWKASQRVSSVLGYLGIQDAARKRRGPSKEPGAWAGSVAHTSNGELVVMTSQEKWDKTQGILGWLQEQYARGGGGNPIIHRKTLESHRGFLIYIARTYPAMVPYLKGIHGTLDSWRGGRDRNGWKLKRKRERDYSDATPDLMGQHDPASAEVKFGMSSLSGGEMEPPEYVTAVDRLKDDLLALMSLASSEKPPRRLVRMKGHVRVVYGFGDASGHGFGSSILMPNGVLLWRTGQWNWTIEQESSSNYKELRNLVEALEEASERGELVNCEVFMFTDNSTAESAYFKGTSSSEHLFDLVLRLRRIEMKGECVIHLIHIAGTRMIWQGSDGLSRGDRNAGVMAGDSMLSFVPLHETALERSDQVRPWVETWAGSKARLLEPSEWPDAHPSGGIYVWVPPPAAADAAVEWLGKSIHKRPTSTHIMIVPRLMTARWRKTLTKTSDLLFTVPVGSNVWNSQQHEPLICAVSLPLSKKKPWRHKGTPYVERIHGHLQELLSDYHERSRPVLRELLFRATALAAM